MVKTFAHLDGSNTVVNIIVAETLEDAELATGATCIEYTKTVHLGQIYDHKTKTFDWAPVETPIEVTDAPVE